MVQTLPQKMLEICCHDMRFESCEYIKCVCGRGSNHNMGLQRSPRPSIADQMFVVLFAEVVK